MIDRILARFGLCRTRNVEKALINLKRQHTDRLYPSGVPAEGGGYDLLIRDREAVTAFRTAKGD